MLEIKDIVNKLSHYYWSPRPPETYTVTGVNGLPAGIGLIAYKEPAAFNITYALHKLETLKDHYDACVTFTQICQIFDAKVNGQWLDWWVTSQTQNEFKAWYKINRMQINPNTRKYFDKV